MDAYFEDVRLCMPVRGMRFFRNNTRMPKEFTQMHWHYVFEILFIRRGWSRQRINAEAMDVHTGDVVFIRPGDVHMTEAMAQDGCDIDVLQFSMDILDKEAYTGVMESKLISPHDDGFRRLFDGLVHVGQAEGPGFDLIMNGLIRVLLGLVLNEGGRQPVPQHSELVAGVCDYVDRASDLRLETVAAYFGYSPEHLSRKFHSEMGVPFRWYCDKVRMRRATIMLHRLGSISEVAEMLGYGDDSSFIRAFRRMYGITPNAYRRLCSPWYEEKGEI